MRIGSGAVEHRIVGVDRDVAVDRDPAKDRWTVTCSCGLVTIRRTLDLAKQYWQEHEINA